MATVMHIARCACLGCGFLLFAPNTVRAFQLLSGEDNVLPSPCATDPDYQEFERIQAVAYRAHGALDFRIVLSPNFQDEVARRTVSALRALPNQGDKVFHVTPGHVREVQDEIKEIRVPTCYENRAYYFIISHLAKDVELARLELGLPLWERPKFGSLPSSDINAYTYPTRDGRGRVIAINAQLFNFVSKMAQLAVSGVDPRLRPGTDSKADIITESLLNISYNQPAKNAFVDAVLGLLIGRPIARIPVDPSKEALVVFFAEAMERFVFAHEYGHVIKRHVSRTVLVPTGPGGAESHEVLARTWKQEFEADVIGLRLLIQLLNAGSADYPDTRMYYIYAYKAPLFFFECMELLDRTRFMLENHTISPVLSDQDKALVRNCADGTLPETDSRCTTELLGSHPPPWLRKERLEKMVDEKIAHLSNRATTEVAAQKGDEMIYDIDLFWKETSDQLLEQIIKPGKAN